MAEQFKTGDVVVLNSGGPNMTVSEQKKVMGKEMVACTWFDGKEQKYGNFYPEAVKLAEKKD